MTNRNIGDIFLLTKDDILKYRHIKWGVIVGTGDILPTDGARFSAFVSYSHVDSATAKKLHRKIETYKLPKRLRHLQTGSAKGGASDGRVGQIFRDRDDLSAALDLSESVKDALTQSRALIVICSPAAKASPWVNKEITLFRELHPGRPILAALVAGEPDEAFPEALLVGGEPLAADLRKESDGWRLGLLKLIAGIAALPLDSLVQRDAQRHLRRVMAVTGGTVVALLAMIGMTIFALQSRNAAQQQQAQAEGLVEYMLTDLRDELKGVGRLDVMTDVNERAMDYYEGQGDLSDRPAESLERRARILHAMGEDDEKRGDLDKALAKFTEAHRVTEALLAQDPENADRIFGHAQSEYWVGRIFELKKKWPQALNKYEAYASSSQKLVIIDPRNADYIMEMGWGRLNIGIIEIKQRKRNSYGKMNFELAIEWMNKAKKIRPNDIIITKEIGNAYAWLADSHFLLLDKISYLNARQMELAAKEKWLRSDVNNNAAKFAVAKAKFSIAIAHLKGPKKQHGQIMLQQAKLMLETLVEIEPNNKTWFAMSERIKRISSKQKEIIE